MDVVRLTDAINVASKQPIQVRDLKLPFLGYNFTCTHRACILDVELVGKVGKLQWIIPQNPLRPQSSHWLKILTECSQQLLVKIHWSYMPVIQTMYLLSIRCKKLQALGPGSLHKRLSMRYNL